MGQMQAELRKVDPTYKNGSALTIGDTATSKKFLWNGLRLTPALYLSRLTSLMAAIVIALLAAIFFHRFDPAREWSLRKARPVDAVLVANGQTAAVNAAPALAEVHLTPMTRGTSASSMPRLVVAELKLMLKGHRWWWYAVAAGLFIASVSSPLEATRGGVAIAALMWPVLVWSQMGTREARCNTASLIFSSEHSLWRQLPAVWMAGVIVAMVTNGGLGIRLAMAGDRQGFLAWIACSLFIPSLALALGVWSGTSKVFEAIYTVWWYVGPANHVPGTDFMGTTAFSARPQLYLVMAGALVVAAYLGRRAKLAYA